MASAELQQRLERFGQEHLIQFWDNLDSARRSALAAQIDGIDFELVQNLLQSDAETVDWASMAERAEPPSSVRADGTGADWSVQDAIDRGQQAIAEGKIGMILVAGGQGSRLGYDKPKGMYPIGPLSGRMLFQMQADRLRAISNRYGVMIPMYIMTSPATHEDTLETIGAQSNFGLRSDQVNVFCQGVMPAVDRETGKLLLESKASLALSPDGHGGTVAAFEKSGCLSDAAGRGIEHLCYAQIDNPLANPCDASLIGHHLFADSDMTTQVVRKREPLEKVGNVVNIDGSVRIIEYIHLPEDIARQSNEDGSLKLWAGNIAIHLFRLDFLREAVTQSERLPFNQAIKRVPFVGTDGELVEPDAPNAIKFERFIFDLLPAARNAFVVEALGSEVFAPVKNADGSPSDTPEHARRAISDLHRSWLTDAGAAVADDVTVEIHPCWAENAREVADRVESGMTISSDRYFDEDPADNELEIVTRCNNSTQAEILRVQLGDEGILCFLQGTNSGLALADVGVPSKGIPVRVRRRDLARAKAFLKSESDSSGI